MNRAQWLSATDPVEMLAFLGGKLERGQRPSFERLMHQQGHRKLGLFGAACCRRLWGRLDAAARELVEAFEAYCDGAMDLHTIAERYCACETACNAVHVLQATGQLFNIGEDIDEDYWQDLLGGLKVAQRESGRAMFKERIQQAGLVREVFGNPFRQPPSEPDPALKASLVVSLAQVAYDQHDWGALPALADALEEAGCADEELLRHCRQPGGEHFRGCWAVDLILGKG